MSGSPVGGAEPIGRAGRWLAALLPPPGELRALVAANLINTVGTGIFVAGGTIFFVRAAGLSVSQLSVGLTIAGCIGLLLSLPIGLLADRIGPREVAIAMLALRAAATAAFLLVHSLPALVLVGSVALCGERGGQVAFGALTARVGGSDRVRLRAYLRAVTNIGVSLGAGLAGLFLALDSELAYAGLMLANAAALLGAGIVLLRVGRQPVLPAPPTASRLPALRDSPYMLAAALHGVLSLSYEVLAFAMPLWVVARTSAPPWIVSALVVLNTGLVIAFQVPASRRVRTARTAAAVGRRSGLVFMACCGLFAASAGQPELAGVSLLVAAVAVLTLGELWYAAASFALSFELAQEHAHGQYQAVYAIGEGLERALAPAVLGALCVAWGPPGWLLLGALFAAGGALLPAVVRASERRTAAFGATGAGRLEQLVPNYR